MNAVLDLVIKKGLEFNLSLRNTSPFQDGQFTLAPALADVGGINKSQLYTATGTATDFLPLIDKITSPDPFSHIYIPELGPLVVGEVIQRLSATVMTLRFVNSGDLSLSTLPIPTGILYPYRYKIFGPEVNATSATGIQAYIFSDRDTTFKSYFYSRKSVYNSAGQLVGLQSDSYTLSLPSNYGAIDLRLKDVTSANMYSGVGYYRYNVYLGRYLTGPVFIPAVLLLTGGIIIDG